MILLYDFLGPAALVGLAVLVFSIPIQGKIAYSTFKAQKAMAKHTDRRNNLVNEALQGIKILKLYGWEDSYEERIRALREDEMKECATYTYRTATMIFFFIGIPLMLNLSVFSVHYSLGGDMSPATIFSAIALIAIIRFPLVMIPMTLQTVISASLALTRMDRFFKLEEIVLQREDCGDEGNAIELSGEFSWGAKKGGEAVVEEAAEAAAAAGGGSDAKDAKPAKPAAVAADSRDIDVELVDVVDVVDAHSP